MSIQSTQSRKNAFLAALIAVVVLMTAAVVMRGVLGGLSFKLTAIAGAIALALTLAWFVSLDEMAKRAHYLAWYWGGSIGLFIAGCILVWSARAPIAALEGLPPWWSDALGREGFMAGALMAMAIPVAGYTIWWVCYWLRNR